MQEKKTKNNKSKTRRIVIITIVCLAIAATLGLIAYHWDSLYKIFSSEESIREFVKGAGVFGPLVFMLLQVVQVVVAPIPGQITGLVGGYLFGPVGLVFSLIGAAIGFTIVFLLARKFGRPLVEKIFSKKIISKFDYITNSKGTFVLFLIFLLPTFPDDLICYLAGLTKIPIRQLIAVSVAGRLPGFLVLNLMGSGLAKESIRPVAVFTALTLIFLAIAYWRRTWLYDFAKSKNHIKFLKEHWKISKAKTILLACSVLVVIAFFCFLAFFDFKILFG